MIKHELARYDAYRDSGVEWLGDIPKNWLIMRIKDVTKKIGNGVTPKGGSEVYTDVGIPFIRSQNVYDDGLRLGGISFISEEINRDMKSSQLKERDILINITGASIGRTCVVPIDLGIANINQHVTFLRIKYWFNSTYISLFLKSPFIKKYIQFEQNGASKEAFNLAQIANIPIVLPNVNEQKAIADYLDTKTAQLDSKIDLLTQKATQYGKLKRSLINETVTRGLDKSVAMKDSGVEWIGEVPKHWEITRAKDLFNKKSRACFDDDEIVTAFRDGEVTLRLNRRVTGFTNAIKEHGYQRIHAGDLVIHAMDAFAGAIGVSDSTGKSSPVYSAYTAKDKEKVYIPYYGILLRQMALSGFISSLGKGIRERSTEFRHKEFIPLKVAVPSFVEQKAIADYLDTKTAHIDRIVTIVNTHIDKLKELRKTLINDVVTGKIKVA